MWWCGEKRCGARQTPGGSLCPLKEETQLGGTFPEVFAGLLADSESPFPPRHQWGRNVQKENYIKATLVQGGAGRALL